MTRLSLLSPAQLSTSYSCGATLGIIQRILTLLSAFFRFPDDSIRGDSPPLSSNRFLRHRLRPIREGKQHLPQSRLLRRRLNIRRWRAKRQR
jgi:hypothetical protein